METAMTKDVQSMVRRCDFLESSLEQIKKSLLIYLKKKAESKHTHHMSTMLKTVGSAETNPQLQDSFFKCSQAYSELDHLLTTYTECEAQQKLLLAEAKRLLVSPIRETLSDCNNALKQKGKKNGKKTKTNHDIRTTTSDDNEVNQRVLHHANILPHHSDMFEKHRLIYMKGILRSVLFAELQYHCQVMEKLSPLFESLALVDENDNNSDTGDNEKGNNNINNTGMESCIRSFQKAAYSSST